MTLSLIWLILYPLTHLSACLSVCLMHFIPAASISSRPLNMYYCLISAGLSFLFPCGETHVTKFLEMWLDCDIYLHF